MGDVLAQATSWLDRAENTRLHSSDRLAYTRKAVEILIAEVERLHALVRSVDLGGTGFLYRPPGGKEVVLAPQDVAVFVAADQPDPAERRGYEQAITHLRDTAGYDAWCDDPLRSLFRSRADDWFRDHFADYLSARLTEETTDGIRQ